MPGKLGRNPGGAPVLACCAGILLVLSPVAATPSFAASPPPGDVALVALLDFVPSTRVVVRGTDGRVSAAIEPTDPKGKVRLAPPGSVQIRFLQPAQDKPVPAGSVWVILGFRSDRPVRSVRLYWGPWGGPGSATEMEVAGPTQQEGSAWAELEVPAGRWVAAAVVQTADGYLAAAAASYQVVGDVSLAPGLRRLSEGLDRPVTPTGTARRQRRELPLPMPPGRRALLHMGPGSPPPWRPPACCRSAA